MAGAGAVMHFTRNAKLRGQLALGNPVHYERLTPIQTLRRDFTPYMTGTHKSRNQLHNLISAVMKGDVRYTDFETYYKSDRDQGLLEYVNATTTSGKVPLELVFADEISKIPFFHTVCNTRLENGNKLLALLWPDMTPESKERVRAAALTCPGFTVPSDGGYRKSRKSRQSRQSRKSRKSRQSRKSRKTRRH
jgi:hypothetical protein